MTFNELLVVSERWVTAKPFGNLAMFVEELIELRECARILSALIAIFLPHEIVGVFFYLFADARMVLQEGLQIRMRLQVIVVVHQRRIVAKLLINILMIVQKLVEARQFLAGNVAILRSLALLR